jgi:hypothetical protein
VGKGLWLTIDLILKKAYRAADNLPNPSLIITQPKVADMISISSEGLCGEEDFRFGRDR